LSALFVWTRRFLTPQFLLSPQLLLSLFWVNLLGTAYGYVWYWDQLVETLSEKPIWMLPFVPDSPTSSLFFTIAIWYLIKDTMKQVDNKKTTRTFIRGLIEALACISSFKYGIWAVGIIISGGLLGSPFDWQDGMLSASHLAMAVEVILFLRFFHISKLAWLFSAILVLLNDLIDYSFDVYPWLPSTLYDYIPVIGLATLSLTILSILLFLILDRYFRTSRD
jgi:uncharacterized membrane protein YpjA